MHKHKLHYDVQTRQVKISGVEIDQIVAIKEQTLPTGPSFHSDHGKIQGQSE